MGLMMTRDNSAEINYKLHIVHQQAIDLLEEITDIVESYRHIKNANYGHVGNLQKVTHDLSDIARFLGKSLKEQATPPTAHPVPKSPYPLFVKGQKVKDVYGQPHTVDSQNGPQVFVDGNPNKWYHPTKIHAVKEEAMSESEDLVKSLLAGNPIRLTNKKAGSKLNTALRKNGFKIAEIESESDQGSVQIWQHGSKKYELAVDHASDETGHFSLYMHPLKESEELNEGTNAMRDWIIHKLENTDEPHDQIVAEFKKKFGADKIKEFDRIVNEIIL
ncbi:Appr-1-p processing enzyme family protein [Rhizobium phage RHph_I1_18]|nr:Appr-1-p processing enzyme family protein [Rhizobium phage RHph_I1_18]